MKTAAIAILACSAAGFTLWFAYTRNGQRAVYVGRHRLAAARVRHMPRYRKWRDRLAPAVRGCLRWPAGQMSRPGPQDELGEVTAWLEELRAPVAASAPGDGPVPAPASGAGPLVTLTGATGTASPCPPPTAPQPALTEPPNPAPNWAPPVTWTPYVPEMLP